TATFHVHAGNSTVFRVSHSPTAETRAAAAPRPIIQRNDQYVIHTTGTKLPSSGQVSTEPSDPQYFSVYSACKSRIPSTVPSKLFVASTDARYGTRNDQISCSPSGVPIL